MPIYMKYGTIKGQSKAVGHQGWIELESAQLGGGRNVTTGTSASRDGSARPPDDIVVSKRQDSSSTLLIRESLQGEGTEVVIDFMPTTARKPGEAPRSYLSITLKNCLISSYSISGHGGDTHGRPMESLSLNCTSISYTTNQEFDLAAFLRSFGLPVP